jgi:fermentation-respiration switch protein FrsA (DUF1100 family)
MTTARSFARRALAPPVSWLVAIVSGNALKPIERTGAVSAPVWIVAGGRNDVVPVKSARAFHEAAQVKGEFLLIPGAAHDDVAARGGADYWAWLTSALGQ